MRSGKSLARAVSACAAEMRGKVSAPVIFTALALAALPMAPATASGAQAHLTWEAPTTATDGSPLTDLAGFRVYIGTAPGEYQEALDAGNQETYLVDNLSAGNTYYFAVTAYSTSGGESAYSGEVSKTFPPDTPPPTGTPAVTPTAPPAATPALSTPFTIVDALSALRYVVGLQPLTAPQQTLYDVAPIGVEGTSHPDGAVNIADVVAILRNAVGAPSR